MIALLLALLVHLGHLGAAVPAPAHGVTVSPAAPAPATVGQPPAGTAQRVPSRRGGRAASQPAVVVPAPPLASSDERPAAPAPVTVAGPDSPVCEPGEDAARDGCAQGQLPDETTGRALG